ncbi:molybdate ABC transporter substrate-binding protein [Massilia sp. BSC265]|uniref:molybdate ABC transporter substrate-binding protein n=1 Tax=Massilia sp. BSC265 TaxID=1549812 RepID=UPI0004E8DC2D|nr:molybdate ABC transporter substrate-binding protein [Massilia sp. BSC265]KFI08328.1 molybdate ABC transporter substrate-binding protein [Massilia sp. BSC265]
MKNIFATLLLAQACVTMATPACAAEVHVAVASNFSAPMKEIAAAFEKKSGHKTILAFGATGKFYAQVRNGAPYGLLVSADAATPARLVSEGLAVPGTAFTYATGRLVLWSAQSSFVDGQGAVLRNGAFAHLAIANPRTAPYGAAAVGALEKLRLLGGLKNKLVQGENIAQTYQFVKTGNAALGFVAMSDVYRGGKFVGGSAWVVPADLHAPIRQDAVVLARGASNPAARELAAYLQSDEVRQIIRFYGYER